MEMLSRKIFPIVKQLASKILTVLYGWEKRPIVPSQISVEARHLDGKHLTMSKYIIIHVNLFLPGILSFDLLFMMVQTIEI